LCLAVLWPPSVTLGASMPCPALWAVRLPATTIVAAISAGASTVIPSSAVVEHVGVPAT
jgi:hypothetical protein